MIHHCLKEGSPDQVNIIPKEKFLNVVFLKFQLENITNLLTFTHTKIITITTMMQHSITIYSNLLLQ